MSPTRRHAREIALQFLYKVDIENRFAELQDSKYLLAGEIEKHFEHFQAPEPTREFIATLISSAIIDQPKLDPKIEEAATSWKLARMATIDRNLLRMSYAEMLRFSGEIPPSVTIDEAIELAKKYGSAETASFVNGVLDALRKKAS